MNQISFDIRRILPNVNEILKPEELIQNINIEQFLKKADEINQLNLANANGLTKDLYHLLKVDDSNLKGIGYACLSSIHTFNGNYKKAIFGINKAFNLNVHDDVYAYILTEYGNLLRQLLRTDEAIAVFDKALQLTDNNNLKWRIVTYKGYCYKYTNKKHSLKLLTEASEYYLNNKVYSRYATVLRHIGLIHIFYNNFKDANIYLSNAKNIADHYSFQDVFKGVKNDIGWLYINEKKFDEAREVFIELLSEDMIPYMESLVLQNLGLLEFKCENYTDAIQYHKKSLQLSSKYEIYQMLFEDYYKLGLANEKLGEYGNAGKYYSKGYEYLLEERKQLGIILLTGYRGKLLNNYIRFLSEHTSIPHVREHSETFKFTVDKTYKEILNIFQKNLLLLHRKREDTIEDLCHTLNISLRLYFVYQKRFGLAKGKRKSITINNQHFKNYLYSMLSLSWRSAIIQFDKDIYRFLLKKYQYNKTKIAQVLDISNLTVIKKTADLV